MNFEEIQENLRQLQDIFEGIDAEANTTFKTLEKDLKIALLKKNVREHDAVKMILGEIERRIILCKKILLNDRGEDRDPVAEKIYKTKVFERMDTCMWVLSLFGSDNDIHEIAKTTKMNLGANKEFMK